MGRAMQQRERVVEKTPEEDEDDAADRDEHQEGDRLERARSPRQTALPLPPRHAVAHCRTRVLRSALPPTPPSCAVASPSFQHHAKWYETFHSLRVFRRCLPFVM